MNRLTFVYPYYNSAGMLQIQLAHWSTIPEHHRAHLKFILIDDASPKAPALDVVKRNPNLDIDLELYRVLKDIPWNQHGARNLGAKMAPDGWLFMSDIDHTLSYEAIAYLLEQPLDPARFYTIQRLTAAKRNDHSIYFELMLGKDGKSKPHPNTFVVTREKFWESGGYDEDYCGTYGGDGPFMRSLEKVAARTHLPEIHLIRWPREVIPDASQPDEFRQKYKKMYRARFDKKGQNGTREIHPVKWLRFPWERVL